jgi:hypothetical protein
MDLEAQALVFVELHKRHQLKVAEAILAEVRARPIWVIMAVQNEAEKRSMESKKSKGGEWKKCQVQKRP